jgi:hypothetical protein
MRGDWPARLPLLQGGFARLDVDILTLQETVRTSEFDQAAEMLGAGYHLAQQHDRETGRAGAPSGQGITTASRWPFGQVVEIDLYLTERTGDCACTSGCRLSAIRSGPD